MRLSIPGYAARALESLDVPPPPRPVRSPIVYTPPNYGQRGPQQTESDTSPPASAHDKAYLQRALGMFLWFARCIDPTLLVALSRLAAQQQNPTARTMESLLRVLQYTKDWLEVRPLSLHMEQLVSKFVYCRRQCKLIISLFQRRNLQKLHADLYALHLLLIALFMHQPMLLLRPTEMRMALQAIQH